MDIFAWQPSDMSGVPRELAEHYLNINPGAKPVKQAMRRFGDKKRRAIGMELAKLLEAGATYQRTMQRCLKDQIGRNVHAYVDDIAVMTRKGSDLLSDLKETFDNLRRYKMMLNPLKCVFGVPAGKLLGFIVSHRGIEVNPEKIKAILNIKRPTCLKDVQRLTGCVAAISRFVSRLGEKALPLYKLLKKTDKFVWDEAADKALQELKNILSSPPILAAPAESEPMLLYIAATNKVISLVIVVVRKEEGFEHGVQRPVYYISEVLTESKQRYPHFQKLAYGVFLGSRKLRHYFQEHPMTVVSKAPLATIINNSDATGRVAKWGIELSAFDINYEARTAIKSQVLADFIADWTEAPEGTPVPEPEAWVMHFDGSKQHQGSGAGVTLKSPTGEELQYVLQIHFEATNNMAEYEALLHGLRIAKEIGIKHIICCGDSDLVAQQVAGTWNARNSVMAAYRDEVDEIAKCFLGYEVKYVRRDDNTAADMLSKLGSGRKPIPPGIFLEHLRPFLDYLIDQKLPEDEVLARQIIRRARSYTIVDGQLYKRSATGVFLKCVSSQDGIEILREIHAGDCGHHAAPRSLVAKAFRLGFYWLTAKEDAEKLVKTCRGCQYYATQPNAPAQELRTIPITWPSAVWGLDMVGKLKKSSPGGHEYLLVAIDKFSKWIEAKPVRKADGATALKFVCSLVTRFGIPHSIITDNGTNFAQGELKDYCDEVGIRLDLASVAHPQSNGQVERANGLILAGIKPRLEEPLRRAAGAWADELDSVLWSLRTTPNRSTGFTPFFLVYGSEAVLPTDIIHDSPRVSAYNEETADEARQLSVDLIEEARNLADQRSTIYQQKLRRYHSHKTLLDTTCSGSFTSNKEEFKRDLLDRIKENAEDWENDKGKESGYADKPPFKPLPPKEGNEEKEEKKKKKEKKKGTKKKRKKQNKELQNTRGKELSGVQITAYFLRIRVQPLQARKNPLWTYAGGNDANRLSNDLSAKDLEKLIRRISRLNKKDPVPSSCRVEPYSSANPLPENHPTMASLPPLPEDGEVEEQAIVAEDNQGSSLHESEVAGSHKSAASHEKEVESEASESTQSLPPAVSPKNKRKRDDAEASGTSKPEEAVPSRPKAAYDPYLETLISSDDEEVVPNVDVAARTSTSHTLVASETPVEGEETSPPRQNVGAATPPSSPLVPSPKRARVETIPEPTLQSSSSSNPLLDDRNLQRPIIVPTHLFKSWSKVRRRKKAELVASEAKAEADEARAKVASVEELQKRLEDAESALNEHKTAQAAREQGILKRLKSQIRRTETQTNQGFDLENPVNDPLLDTLSYLELHGSEIREGVANASAGLSTLFPYFFPKKEEPPTFLTLAKSFNSSEDLGLKMRQENMKVAVESTVALVADSQQTVDWMKVGDTDQIEQSRWRSLIKAAKPNTKKILAYLGIKPSSTPSSSRPEV
ncbi:hypothetical protein QYE76_047006 [Lolium multiflorum]|uniref:Integrase catalytic domain-containing protein n=1 Tax=Lolium multiflorum TaxID=4521 RepID=A0AAD8TQM5_LOLMU|nr:hypothetical protein QYE76_047006 [Lolium multiflorum]